MNDKELKLKSNIVCHSCAGGNPGSLNIMYLNTGMCTRA